MIEYLEFSRDPFPIKMVSRSSRAQSYAKVAYICKDTSRNHGRVGRHLFCDPMPVADVMSF